MAPRSRFWSSDSGYRTFPYTRSKATCLAWHDMTLEVCRLQNQLRESLWFHPLMTCKEGEIGSAESHSLQRPAKMIVCENQFDGWNLMPAYVPARDWSATITKRQVAMEDRLATQRRREPLAGTNR